MRITQAMIEPLSSALRKTRATLKMRQAEMAAGLGISRKTYVLLESSRWYPPYKERAHMIRCLHELDPSLVAVFVGVAGESLEEHVLTVTAPAEPVRAPSAAAVKKAYAEAIAQVAAEQDMTVSAVTKVATGLVARLVAAGVGLDAVAAIASRPNR